MLARVLLEWATGLTPHQAFSLLLDSRPIFHEGILLLE
jgi:hypothetical protein